MLVSKQRICRAAAPSSAHVVVLAGPPFSFVQFADGLLNVLHCIHAMTTPMTTGMLEVVVSALQGSAGSVDFRRARRVAVVLDREKRPASLP